MIEPSLNDLLLRRQLQSIIDQCGSDARLLREACELLAESYVQARIAAKWLAADAVKPVGTLPGVLNQNRETELD